MSEAIEQATEALEEIRNLSNKLSISYKKKHGDGLEKLCLSESLISSFATTAANISARIKERMGR